jgi:hypothetical protein
MKKIQKTINIEKVINSVDVISLITSKITDYQKNKEIQNMLIELIDNGYQNDIIDRYKENFIDYMKEVFQEQCTVYSENYFIKEYNKLNKDKEKDLCSSFPLIHENIKKIDENMIDSEGNKIRKSQRKPVEINVDGIDRIFYSMSRIPLCLRWG